jgi:hypothetical protein
VPYSLTAKDFNEDGKIDLVSSNFGSGGVSLLLNDCESSGRIGKTNTSILNYEF